MSTFDTEKGQFQLSFLEAKVPIPKSAEEYKTSIFPFDTRKILEILEIYLHNQVSEMLYYTLIISSMETSKLQASLNNIHTQLKMGRMSSLSKIP